MIINLYCLHIIYLCSLLCEGVLSAPEIPPGIDKNEANLIQSDLPVVEASEIGTDSPYDPTTEDEQQSSVEDEIPYYDETSMVNTNTKQNITSGTDEDVSGIQTSSPSELAFQDVCEVAEVECSKPPQTECTCSSVEESSTTCTSFGRITSHKYNGHCIYKLPVEKDEKVLVYFLRKSISTLSDTCWLNISGQIYDKDVLVQDENVFAALENVTVVGMRGDESCDWTMTYRIEKQQDEQVKDLFCKRGIIKPPQDRSCLQNYPLRTNFTWNLSAKEKNNCRIQFNVTYLDVGSSLFGNKSAVSSLPSVDNLDYLFIGPGKWSEKEEISTQDALFYGYIEEPTMLQVNSCSAHVRFVSHMHYQQAQGFEMDFNVLDEESPPLDEETAAKYRHPPMPFGYTVDTWVALNGLMQANEMSQKRVKNGLSAMANDFLRDKQLESNITSDDVYILAAAECHLVYCQMNCVAFNFIIHYSVNGTWVFRRHILNEMLVLYSPRNYFGDDVQLCLEFYDSTWKALGMLVIIISMTGAFMAVIMCIAKERSYHTKARSQFNRWRSSSTRRSIESLSSHTTYKSYSVPLPGFGNDFAWYPPKEKTKEVKNDFEQMFSNQLDDPKIEVKEPEVKPVEGSYSNTTFRGDDDENDIYSRERRPNAIMESDGSDSDFEPYITRSGVYHVSGMDTGEAIV